MAQYEEEYPGIELIGEDGQSVSFRHILTFECQGRHYLALQQDEDEEGMVTLMRIREEGEAGEVYEIVEDEAELDRAFEEFLAIMEEDGD